MIFKGSIFLVIFTSILFSCGKQKRIEKRLDGHWEIEEMRVIDGQGFTHYIQDAIGELSLDFESNISNGMVCQILKYY